MGTIPDRIRIATRESQLALRQADLVATALRQRYPRMQVELVGMTTIGDRILDRPLAQVGGKGLFVKELESALAEQRADIAVHSLKDVPMDLPRGFSLRTFGEREAPLDAFVSTRFSSFEAMPAGAVVGTSSLRRECQLRHAFPALTFRPLRGNVNTRLGKLDRGDYDAIVLAVAGLRRLELDERISATIPATVSLPAIGQGILGIEYRDERADIASLFVPFEQRATAVAARAERALGRIVEGSCDVPLGALATVAEASFSIEAFIGVPDGSRLVRMSAEGDNSRAEAIGIALGERLLASGGREILDGLKRTTV